MRKHLLKSNSSLFRLFPCMLFFAVICSYGKAGAQTEPQNETRTVTGYVYDEQKNPLAGVSVVIKGTTRGVISGADGAFAIPLPQEGATLRFNYLGMLPREIQVTVQTNLDVTMRHSATSIDDVIVTGYGVIQKREDFMGSATQVNAEQLKTMPTVRLDRMLEGLVPGMEVNAGSDIAEGRNRYNVRVRGESSLSAGREPIWIVDGVRLYTGDNNNAMNGSQQNISPLSMINPYDIESVVVLKDASQTVMYGADGSNGVILVTTKKSARGKPIINASVRYGLSMEDKSTRLKLLNGPQYLELAKEAWLNKGRSMDAFPWQDNSLNKYSDTDTNWYDLYYGLGKTLDANVSITGGGERIGNKVTLRYYDNQPILKGNRTQTINVAMKSDVDLLKRLKFSANMDASYAMNRIFSGGRDVWSNLPIISPYYDGTSVYRLKNKIVTPLTLEPGDLDPFTGDVVTDRKVVNYPYDYRFANRLAERDENTVRNNTLDLRGSARLSYEIIKGLTAEALFNVGYSGSTDKNYYARTNLASSSWERVDQFTDYTRPLVWSPEGSALASKVTNMLWESKETLSFARAFGKHSVGAYAFFELSEEKWDYASASARGFPNDKMMEVNYADPETELAEGNSRIKRKMSYYVGANYSFDSRYYIGGSLRRDGSSTFGEYHQWATAWSVTSGWNIHNEPFFRVPAIDMLKIRGTYGVTGNSRIGSVGKGTIQIGDSFGYRQEIGGIMSDAPNPGLTWENKYKLSVGMDLSMLKGAISLSVDFYNDLTRDVISELSVSNLTGTRNMARNSGIIRNRGIEINLSTRNISTPLFTWRTQFNISHNKNKVVKLFEEASKSFSEYGWYEGYEVNVWTLIQWAGVDPRDGAPLWYDRNGNVTREYNYGNRVPRFDISRNPTVYGSLNNQFDIWDFQLDIRIIYSIGGWERPHAMMQMDDGQSLNNLTSAGNVPVETLDRWQKPGQIATVPVLIDADSRMSRSFSNRFFYNKTHFRLSNVSLSYKLPQRFCEKLKLKALRVAFLADNLYFLSPGQSKDRNSYKTTYSSYPQERMFSLQLDLTF